MFVARPYALHGCEVQYEYSTISSNSFENPTPCVRCRVNVVPVVCLWYWFPGTAMNPSSVLCWPPYNHHTASGCRVFEAFLSLSTLLRNTCLPFVHVVNLQLRTLVVVVLFLLPFFFLPSYHAQQHYLAILPRKSTDWLVRSSTLLQVQVLSACSTLLVPLCCTVQLTSDSNK